MFKKSAILGLASSLIILSVIYDIMSGTAEPNDSSYVVVSEKGRMVSKKKVIKSEKEWKESLTREQFYILRKKGTERPFTGEYNRNKENGVYRCAACGNELFHSKTKYDSGTGWPSFYTPVSQNNILTEADNSFFMKRTEILCSRCGGHLGHVFDDGPEPTYKRYCINSASLKFEKE